MTQEATQHQQGAPSDAEPTQQKAFPDPAPGGVVDIDPETGEDTGKRITPRDAMLQDMESRIDAERQREIHEYQTELAEASGLDLPAESTESPGPAEPGVATVEKMHEEGTGNNSHLPDELQNDPLAEYIVMDGENAMFKTKVDGEERLIPLDAARAQLQKHVAAEIRLQQAAEERKQLEEREKQIRQNEAILAERLKKAEESSALSEPEGQDVSDQDLENEARQVVSSMFSGTEDEAVAHLANLLKSTRQAPGPRVDPEELANQAVAAAKQTLEAERAKEEAEQKQRDINAAFKQFGKDYPDIMGDANLFRYADSLTNSIEAEHPDWTPGQVMAEAGKQTREWVESLQGKASEQTPQPNGRQTSKEKLVPMPQARSQQHPTREPEETPDTPQRVMEEIRKSRGQA